MSALRIAATAGLFFGVSACSLAAGLDRFGPAEVGGGGAGIGGASTSSLGGAGGAGGADVGSGGAPDCATHLLISEARTRGDAGSTDDFIEITNPTGSPIPLQGFELLGRSASGVDTERQKWLGAAQMLAPGAHVLVAGEGFDDGATPDEVLASNESLGEDTVLVLRDPRGELVDSLCLCAQSCANGDWSTCPGAPIENPNVAPNGDKLDLDRSVVRDPECRDSDTPADFAVAPSDAQSLTSP